MITLRAGGWAATLLPERGAAFAALTLDGRDVLVPVPPGGDANAGFHGAFWMAPWTNRLDGGRIVVDGVTHAMPINRPTEANALHGFVRDLAWTVEASAASHAVLACTLRHPPFHCAAQLEVTLTDAGLALSFALTNRGAAATPVGFGWHPFFVRPPGTRLSFRASTRFGRDARGLAIDPLPTEGLDDDALDGLDNHFAGWDGTATFGDIVLRASGAWSRNLQIFAPAGVLCVEPVSHAPNAVNDPGAAAHGAMPPLPAGGTIAGSLTLQRR